jgi:hypothetical protein
VAATQKKISCNIQIGKGNYETLLDNKDVYLNDQAKSFSTENIKSNEFLLRFN